MAKAEQVFNVYIDEAGDEGFKFRAAPEKGSSRFFVLSALIVPATKDSELARVTTEIKRMLNYQPRDMHRPLHFCKLGHDKRKVCVNKLADFDGFEIITVVFDKQHCYKDYFKTPKLYHTACHLLLLNLNVFLNVHIAKAHLIFDNRGNTRHSKLKEYVEEEVDTSRFLSSVPRPSTQVKCLQLADIIASSIYQAFEPNQYNDVEPCFIQKLHPKIFCHNGKCWGSGLTLAPLFKDFEPINYEQEKYSWLTMLQNTK